MVMLTEGTQFAEDADYDSSTQSLILGSSASTMDLLSLLENCTTKAALRADQMVWNWAKFE